jgi:hypothetical protein
MIHFLLTVNIPVAYLEYYTYDGPMTILFSGIISTLMNPLMMFADIKMVKGNMLFVSFCPRLPIELWHNGKGAMLPVSGGLDPRLQLQLAHGPSEVNLNVVG